MFTMSMIFALFVASMATAASIPPCVEPSTSQLLEQWAEHIQEAMGRNFHESYYSMDFFRMSIADQLAANSSAKENAIYGDMDNSHCTSSHVKQHGALHESSYCPWYYVINQSDYRYPRAITEARCRCQSGAGMGAATACKQVNYSIRVLRRTGVDKNGVCVYTPGWQNVGVGCTTIKSI